MDKPTALSVVLTFHGVGDPASIPVGHIAPSTARYFVCRERLEQVLTAVSPASCCTAAEFTVKADGLWSVLTFDDGLITDFEVSFPQLTACGLRATFFVNVENIGKKGYADLAHLREMIECGMEIGSHGLTHRYLTTMPASDVVEEIIASKLRLEDLLRVEVCSYAPVGGHYAAWMAKVAAEAGYRVFATMVPGRSRNRGCPVLLRRNHLQADHTERYALRLLSGDRRMLLANRLRYSLLKVPKILLGMHNYDRLKSLLLQGNRDDLDSRETLTS